MSKEIIEKIEEAIRQYLPECDISLARFLHPIIVKDCLDQALTLLKQPKDQPNSEFVKECRETELDEWSDWRIKELCDRFGTSESINKDLLEACREYSKAVILLRETELPLGAAIQLSNADKLGLTAIAKAKR